MSLTNKLLFSLNIIFLFLLACIYGIFTESQANASSGYKTITLPYVAYAHAPVDGQGVYVCGPNEAKYVGPLAVSHLSACSITFKVPK